MIMLGNREFRRISQECWDAVLRLEDLDRQGIDLQVISATPVLFSYDRPVEQALEAARIFNDAALEMCGCANGRLKALCQVPLQDIDASCAEVSRCMRAGHIGVQIGNHVGPKNLDDSGIVTFLHHCADIGAPVLVHPWDMMAPDRMPKYMMPWTVGMPAETQLAVSALVLSGAFDRLPKTLRICFAHGGGSLAYLLGRMQNAWEHQPLCRGAAQFPPVRYLDRFHVDSAIFDQRSLKLLVVVMGEDHVMLGSDYPYPLGEEHIGELIRQSQFSAEAKGKMLAGNATEFFGLSSIVRGEAASASKEPAIITSSRRADDGAHTHTLAPLLNYGSYLRVPELLELQNQLSSPSTHDELLFII